MAMDGRMKSASAAETPASSRIKLRHSHAVIHVCTAERARGNIRHLNVSGGGVGARGGK